MKKVAQQCSTGAAGGVRATRGKSATRGAARATSGANLCHQWHYNYQGNYQRTKGGAGPGEGEVSKRVIPFASPAPTKVVPLHAPITVSLSMVRSHQNTVVTAKGTEAWFAIRPAEFETGKVTKFDKEKAA